VILPELVVALIVAFIFAMVLRFLLRRRGPGPWAGWVFFLILLFAAGLAGGIWFEPLGPQIRGVSWLNFAIAGLIVALVITALSPGPAGAAAGLSRKADDRNAVSDAVVATMGLVFWAVIVGLAAIIVIRHALR
jgi:hypothetical protein